MWATPRSRALFDGPFHAFLLGQDRVYAIARNQAGRRNSSDDSQPMITAISTAARP